MPPTLQSILSGRQKRLLAHPRKCPRAAPAFGSEAAGTADLARVCAAAHREDAVLLGGDCMSNAFIDKLKGFSALSVDDVRLLEAACGKPREIPARQDLIREGDKPGPIFVILRGWACR